MAEGSRQFERSKGLLHGRGVYMRVEHHFHSSTPLNWTHEDTIKFSSLIKVVQERQHDNALTTFLIIVVYSNWNCSVEYETFVRCIVGEVVSGLVSQRYRYVT